jgi:hypothetical protein
VRCQFACDDELLVRPDVRLGLQSTWTSTGHVKRERRRRDGAGSDVHLDLHQRETVRTYQGDAEAQFGWIIDATSLAW